MMRGGWTGLLVLAMAVAGSFWISCARKPAYSEIQSKDSQRTRATEQPAANSSDQPATPPAGETPAAPEQPASPPAQPPETAAKKGELRIPDFIDQRTGEFKDLPSYPNAYRTNAQIGPISGAETGMFVLTTAEPFPRIAAFYDAAIKKHGWIIVSHIRDPEHLRWELSKGKTSEGLVEVKGESTSNMKSIALSRVEKAPAK